MGWVKSQKKIQILAVPGTDKIGIIITELYCRSKNEWIEEHRMTGGCGSIKINGILMPNIRYADDVLLTNNKSDIQKTMDRSFNLQEDGLSALGL